MDKFKEIINRMQLPIFAFAATLFGSLVLLNTTFYNAMINSIIALGAFTVGVYFLDKDKNKTDS